MSLDGGLHIAYALGTAAGYDEQIQREGLRQRAPLNKARQLLKMAAALADKMARLEPVRLRVQHPSVVVQLLAESASAQADPADRSLAYSILSAVLRQKAKSTWAGRNPQLSQLVLF
ncbi:hypothetical protein ASC78_08560 [Variovorax sp. Root318D1]|nr:hypothetical protein ASC78_08560 [Variovorax sp. Root318D1]